MVEIIKMEKQLIIIKEKCKDCNGTGIDTMGDYGCLFCNNGYTEDEIDLNKWLVDNLKELKVLREFKKI